MKNPLALAMLVCLGAILAYAFLFASSTQLVIQLYPNQTASNPYCQNGLTKQCSVGNCSGTTECINGAWSACGWHTVCSPGDREACISNGCTYAIKECNGCGTGFGPCSAP